MKYHQVRFEIATVRISMLGILPPSHPKTCSNFEGVGARAQCIGKVSPGTLQLFAINLQAFSFSFWCWSYQGPDAPLGF